MTKNPTAGRRQGSGIKVWADSRLSTAAASQLQHNIDLTALLAIRSRVDPATVRAQLIAWGLAVRS